jgi:hypothetical protein
MANLPNVDLALVELRKLEEYVLHPTHPRGRHKARVFERTLGIGRDDAAWLRSQILSALNETEAIELEPDSYGRRWRADVAIGRQDRSAVVRTLWLMRTGERVPRFVTCWVL